MLREVVVAMVKETLSYSLVRQSVLSESEASGGVHIKGVFLHEQCLI